jgi:hypothetical protein
MVVALSAAVDTVPLVGSAPLQPPEAVHAVALVELHVSIAVPPDVTLVGLAVMVAVGAGGSGGGGLPEDEGGLPEEQAVNIRPALNNAVKFTNKHKALARISTPSYRMEMTRYTGLCEFALASLSLIT